MKKLLLLPVLFVSVLSFGQINQGKITYSMEYISDDPDMAMAATMMAGSKMVLQFFENKTRTDVSMGTMGTISTIIDEKANQFLMLMDMMGQKTAISNTITELEKTDDNIPKFTFQKTDETKIILGYKCQKSIMTSEDGMQFDYWCTNDIKSSMKGQQYLPKGAPGFPLQYSMSSMGLKIVMTALSIEKDVDKKLFSTKVPEGYTVQTIEGLKSMGDNNSSPMYASI